LPPSSVTTTLSLPSALTSVIGLTMPLAADLVSSPRWWFKVATTSFASSDLPLWNSTPLRSLKVQVAASAEASQLSANSPTSSPLGEISVRLLRSCPKLTLIM
jgi:hypothetical protein